MKEITDFQLVVIALLMSVFIGFYFWFAVKIVTAIVDFMKKLI